MKYTFKLGDPSNVFWLTLTGDGSAELRNARNKKCSPDLFLGTDTAEFQLMVTALMTSPDWHDSATNEAWREDKLTKVVKHYHKNMPATLWSASFLE